MKKRVVCEACNNGWMSRAEISAKPAILKIKDTPFTALSSQEVKNIAKWCAQKAYLFTYCEALRHPTVVSANAEQRDAMLYGSAPLSLMTEIVPGHYTVAICSLTEPRWGMNNIYYYFPEEAQDVALNFSFFGAVGYLGFWVSTNSFGRERLFAGQDRSKGTIRVVHPLLAVSAVERNRNVRLRDAQRFLRQIIPYPVNFIGDQSEMPIQRTVAPNGRR